MPNILGSREVIKVKKMIKVMKKIKILGFAIAAIAILALGGARSQAQDRMPEINLGVGPVTAASVTPDQFPRKIKSFLDKHFKGIAIASSETEFPSRNIEVKLADGTDLEFAHNGTLIEVEAPDNKVISSKLLKDVVSREVYRDLKSHGLTDMVEGVTHDGFGYKIELNDKVYEEARYAEEGYLVALYTE